ncbi:MAG TPA: DUF2567 domain-containing protein [Pilimelia sp.]|nr:DUF2567 domain-containing protein [Pilimelia sp.]
MTPRPPRGVRRAQVRGAAVVTLLLAVLGAPLALLWYALAPTVPVRVTADGQVLVSTQPEQFVAADGWFAILGTAFGVLAAAGTWALARRHRGPAQLVAVVLGAGAAGLVAWGVGGQLGQTGYQERARAAPVGARLHRPPELRTAKVTWVAGVLPVPRGGVLAPALGAATCYTLLAGWSRFPSLRRHEDEDPAADPDDPPWPAAEPVSSAADGAPTPPAASAPPAPDAADHTRD